MSSIKSISLCDSLCLRVFVVQIVCTVALVCIGSTVNAQLKWTNVSSEFGSVPSSIQVFRTTDTIQGKPNIAFYVIADLNDKKLTFTTDTSSGRRLTPSQFFVKNEQPLVVVNGTFFSFETNRNLNLVIKDKKLVSYNIHTNPLRGKDTFTYRHPFHSAIGITKKRKADVAWIYTDSSVKYAYASQVPVTPRKDSTLKMDLGMALHNGKFEKWKMKTAIGGGPVLVQGGQIAVSNNEELKFAGKAIDDKHPRTAMGYTSDGKLVIMVVQGRFPGVAEGASLTQLAKMMADIGCLEALNLDGGGSSCMLINGKETIAPSDKQQRSVPAVFMISTK